MHNSDNLLMSFNVKPLVEPTTEVCQRQWVSKRMYRATKNLENVQAIIINKI